MLTKMKHVIWIFIVLIGCNPSNEEKIIADYEQRTDLDIISLDKIGPLVAKDSVPILSKMTDSLAYIKMQELFKRISKQIDLIEKQNGRVILAKNKADDTKARDVLSLYESILETQKKRLSFYESKVYDSTDLREINQRLRLYERKPDSVLATKYRCVYADGDRKITKTYHIRGVFNLHVPRFLKSPDLNK